MTAASTPREVIARALWGQDYSEYDYDQDDPGYQRDADAILSALTEAGWEVARLEFAGRYTEDGVDGPCMYWDGSGDLYRKLLPQEEAP